MNLLLVTFLVLLLTYLFKILIYQMTVLKKHGIKDSIQIPFLGNIEFLRSKNRLKNIQGEKFKKYGPIYGYVLGDNPQIFVSDEELMRRILIKDFHLFKNRGNQFKSGFIFDPHECHTLFSLRDDDWKRVRSLLKTCFSSMKLKSMTSFIQQAVEDMISEIEVKVKDNQEIDLKPFFEKMTLQVIADGGFGIDPQEDKELYDKVLILGKQIFNLKSILVNFLLNSIFGDAYGILQRILYKLGLIQGNPLVDLIKQNIERRRKGRFKRNDMLHLMLDHEGYIKDDYQQLDVNVDDNDYNVDIKTTSTLSKFKQLVRLSQGEVMMNSFIFFLAGFTTTSLTLLFVAYFLIRYPEYQEKIRKEAQNLYKEEGKLDYNTLSKLPFLDAFVNESMRYYPVVNLINRQASVNYKYNDIIIPKGSIIFISSYFMHHSSKFWDLPEHFDPFRFLPPNKASINNMAFLPFGLGPRNCIAMRLALLEVKMCIAMLLMKYRLEPGEYLKTHSLTIEENFGQLAPKSLPVKAVPITEE